jgi:hypothetical protein
MKIKFHKLSILAAIVLTIIMLLVAMIFDVSKEMLQSTEKSFFTPLFISFVLMIGVNYIVLELLFNFYGKGQIRRISNILMKVE